MEREHTMSQSAVNPGKTMLKRVEQHRDRWSVFGGHAGLTYLSEKLPASLLKEYEIFEPYDEEFLEKIRYNLMYALDESDF